MSAVHVDDAADAYICALESGTAGSTYNIAGERLVLFCCPITQLHHDHQNPRLLALRLVIQPQHACWPTCSWVDRAFLKLKKKLKKCAYPQCVKPARLTAAPTCFLQLLFEPQASQLELQLSTIDGSLVGSHAQTFASFQAFVVVATAKIEQCLSGSEVLHLCIIGRAQCPKPWQCTGQDQRHLNNESIVLACQLAIFGKRLGLRRVCHLASL